MSGTMKQALALPLNLNLGFEVIDGQGSLALLAVLGEP